MYHSLNFFCFQSIIVENRVWVYVCKYILMWDLNLMLSKYLCITKKRIFIRYNEHHLYCESEIYMKVLYILLFTESNTRSTGSEGRHSKHLNGPPLCGSSILFEIHLKKIYIYIHDRKCKKKMKNYLKKHLCYRI